MTSKFEDFAQSLTKNNDSTAVGNAMLTDVQNDPNYLSAANRDSASDASTASLNLPAMDIVGMGTDESQKAGDGRRPDDRREGEEKTGTTNQNDYSDLWATDEKGRINEFHYNGQKHSFKIEYDEQNQPKRIVTPDGRSYVNAGEEGWQTINPNNRQVEYKQFGKISVDEYGVHADGSDAKELRAPERKPGNPEDKVVRTETVNGNEIGYDKDGRIRTFFNENMDRAYTFNYDKAGKIDRIITPDGLRYEHHGRLGWRAYSTDHGGFVRLNPDIGTVTVNEKDGISATGPGAERLLKAMKKDAQA